MSMMLIVAKLPAWNWFVTVSTRCVARCQPHVLIHWAHQRGCHVSLIVISEKISKHEWPEWMLAVYVEFLSLRLCLSVMHRDLRIVFFVRIESAVRFVFESNIRIESADNSCLHFTLTANI